MAHIKTETEWENEMCAEIIEYIAGEIYVDLRFMQPALTALIPKGNAGLDCFATNGEYIYANPIRTMDLFKKNERFLERAYLHTVLHCVYCHLWIMQDRDKRLWDIACDIAVERVIDGLDKPCTRRILSWTRQSVYEELEKSGYISSSQIYEMLRNKPAEDIERYEKEFFTDAHFFWENDDNHKAAIETADNGIQKQWEKRAREISLLKDRMGDAGDATNRLTAMIRCEKAKRSYSVFLKKFAAVHEELKSSPDEFDIGFYTYGLSRYKNMPLIEPLETREVRKIKEFVVAVDTSYSTNGEPVRRFLEETFSILMDESSFFGYSKIHIIQSDSVIQSHDVIKNRNELESFFQSFELKGGGSTDFRPVFRYVDKQIEDGAISNLGGLIYFTDGKGTFPQKRPNYKTAFIFLNEYEEENVPAWAMRLRVDENTFRVKGSRTYEYSGSETGNY